MVSTLKLYKEVMVNGTSVEAVPFPNEDHQAMLADYKYSASRMSNAPSITATLNYPTCLDAEWSDRVYVEFRGEKYYIKGVPSSSHDNNSNLYKHNLEFTSERIILDSVYFFDVVQENSENDKPVANSADFSFYGTVKEFAERLNRSMLWSGVGGDGGYKVVIDSGVEFKDAMYTASNQYISDALKSMYETYELPYYFVGKEIHIGYAEKVIEDPLKYGAKNSLISVGKNYTNDKIVNRITGTGSDKNITYYYPNPTPKGVIALSGESADKYEVYDNKAFASKIDLERPFHSEIGVAEVKSTTSLIPCFDNEYKTNVLVIGTRETYMEYSVEITFTARHSGTAMGYSVIPLKTIMTVNNKAVSLAPYFISGMLYDNAGNSWEVGLGNGTNPTSFVTNDGIRYYGKTFTLKLMLCTNSAERVNVKVTGDVDPYVVEDTDISTVFRSAHKFSTSIALEVPENNSGRIFLRNLFTTLSKPSTTLADYYITGGILNNDKEVGIATISNDEVIGCGYLTQGSYVVKCEYELPFGVTPYNTTVSTEDVAIVEWLYDDEQKFIDIEKAGIRVKEGYATENLDKLKQELVKRVNVQNKLMPSLYRETDGNERFYIAENDKYKDEEGNDIVFKRPYSKDRPKEYILNNDEIFPTIEGMTNASGLRIDMFSEFAYDKDDNDEIYPEDYEDSNLAGKYKHPYFFGKLRKFNGEHGFNLFDHAIEGGEMTFSFKTGKVGGCNFKVGVDEDEGKYNLVQVYEVDTYEDGFGWHRKGELKRDEDGNVLSGYAPNGGSQTPQACQQDTVNNEVWIALKKDVDTFGVLMPNDENSYRPSTEDTFVIINIDLPEAYVTAAEKRLENEIIKYMSENNDYKFTFSAKLSRIFFAENDKFASELNENSKVSVEYNGVIYPMYISSYSYSVNGTEVLPEVQIELNDEIKIFKSAKQKTNEAINNKIANIINSTVKVNTTTNDKIDSVINFVTKVDNIEKRNSEAISIIASDRQLYLSEKVVVDNNYKLIEAEYDNFVSTYSDVVDAGSDELSDLDGISLQVRDTTNALSIFRETTKAYEKQLNAVILSSGIVTPDLDIQFARDNYYASLANVKEKISSSTKESINSAEAKISDLDYLKQTFGEDSVSDNNGVTLSRMMSVKDENNNVVAGLYGGGVGALNDNLEDAEHGTLMFFAGANSVQEAKDAKHRVYEDGTVYIKEGIFEGVIQHRVVKITKANIGTILSATGVVVEDNTAYTITPMMMSAIMDFTNQNVALKFTNSDRIAFMLPVLYGYTLYGANDITSKDELRGLVGTRFIVYNNTPATIAFCGKRYYPESNSFDSADVCYPDWIMGLGEFAIVECKISKDGAEREVIYWDINVGRHIRQAFPVDE